MREVAIMSWNLNILMKCHDKTIANKNGLLLKSECRMLSKNLSSAAFPL